jgi:hypothetical protein
MNRRGFLKLATAAAAYHALPKPLLLAEPIALVEPAPLILEHVYPLETMLYGLGYWQSAMGATEWAGIERTMERPGK